MVRELEPEEVYISSGIKPPLTAEEVASHVDKMALICVLRGEVGLMQYRRVNNLTARDARDIAEHPDFLRRLRWYTLTELYLPRHREIMERRLSEAAGGNRDQQDFFHKEYFEVGGTGPVLREVREVSLGSGEGGGGSRRALEEVFERALASGTRPVLVQRGVEGS